jgi:hypothetical protein
MRFTHGTTGRGISLVTVICLCVVQIGALAPVAHGGAPADDLKQIQYRYYFRGKYDQAVTELQKFLARTDVDADVARSAREFLAASHVLTGDVEAGREIFLTMLNEDPSYAGPDPATFREEVLAEWSSARDMYASNRIRNAPVSDAAAAPGQQVAAVSEGKPIYKKWWFYAAGAATLLLIAGAVSSEKSDGAPARGETGSVSVGVTVR